MCYFNCENNFTSNDLIRIKQQFGSLSTKDKQLFLMKSVKEEKIKSVTFKKNKLHFKLEEKEVCKQFF
jgi:hypothetical protein